jgi:hypothetical protein
LARIGLGAETNADEPVFEMVLRIRNDASQLINKQAISVLPITGLLDLDIGSKR